MQRLFPLVICWLICHHAQTIDYVTVQTPDPFPQNFISRNDWNSQKIWTMNPLSTPQMFQSFSHKCKSLFLQSCPKDFIRFLCECIINLLKGNLQRIKRHHLVKFRSEVWLLFLKQSTWKQRRDILPSERGLQLIEVITPPVINHLFWCGPICSRSCFCVQQKFDYPVIYKAGTFKLSTFTKFHVPNWFTLKGDKQKFIFQSRLFSRQNFDFSMYQALKFTNFNLG